MGANNQPGEREPRSAVMDHTWLCAPMSHVWHSREQNLWALPGVPGNFSARKSRRPVFPQFMLLGGPFGLESV